MFKPLSTKNAVKCKIRTWAQLVNALIKEQGEDQGSVLSNTEDAKHTKNILRVCGDGFRLLLLFERQSSCAHTAGTALCAPAQLNKNYHKSCVIKLSFIRV